MLDLGEMDRHSLFALCRFLMHRRMLWLQRSETLPNKDTEARYVDEALLVAYALTDAQMAGRLVRSQNACRAEFVETFFTPLGRFEDVLDFFHNRGLHREAAVYLERWTPGTA